MEWNDSLVCLVILPRDFSLPFVVSPSLALTYFVDPQVLKEKNGPKEIVKIENKLKEKEINKVRLVCSQLIFRDRIILQ